MTLIKTVLGVSFSHFYLFGYVCFVQHEKQLHTLANALLEYETLTAEDIKRILLPNQEGEKLQEQQEEGDLVLA